MNKVALLFSGQGSQYPGMGKSLYEQNASVRELFEQASDVLQLDMKSLCFNASGDALSQTENTQPSVMLVSLAFWKVFQQETGITPIALAGHSLGELTALTAAGVFSVKDGLQLARARGIAMSQGSNESSMLAINKLDTATLESLCKAQDDFGKEFVIANYNSPKQHVLSGGKKALETISETLKDAGAMVIPLRVSGAFHSPFMQVAVPRLEAELDKIGVNKAHLPVFSNVTARLYEDNSSIKEQLLSQLTSPVRWLDIMYSLKDLGATVFIEAGPKDILKKLVVHTFDKVETFALDDNEDRSAMERYFQSDIRQHKTRPNLLGKCLAVAVATRNTNWDEDAYNEGVIKPYQQLKNLHESIQSQTTNLNDEIIFQAKQLLEKILVCKGASESEIKMRYQQIAEQTNTPLFFTEQTS